MLDNLEKNNQDGDAITAASNGQGILGSNYNSFVDSQTNPKQFGSTGKAEWALQSLKQCIPLVKKIVTLIVIVCAVFSLYFFAANPLLDAFNVNRTAPFARSYDGSPRFPAADAKADHVVPKPKAEDTSSSQSTATFSPTPQEAQPKTTSSQTTAHEAPTSPSPEYKGERYYINQIDQLNTNTLILQSQLTMVLEAAKERDLRINELKALMGNLSNDVHRLDSSVEDKMKKVTKLSDESVEMKLMVSLTDRAVKEIQGDVKQAEFKGIQNEANLKTLLVTVKDNQTNHANQMSKFNDGLNELSTLIANKSHIEDTPQRINFMNGTKITTIDPNTNLDELASYGLTPEPKVIQKYHYHSSLNGTHWIVDNLGRRFPMKIGQRVENFGVIQDYIPNLDIKKAYLVLNSGYRITHQSSKR